MMEVRISGAYPAGTAVFASDNAVLSAFTQKAVDPTAAKIDSFAKLPLGWDYGHGGPLPVALLDIAKIWNEYLRTQGVVRYTDACPGHDSVTVAAGLLGGHYLEIVTSIGRSIRYAIAHDFNNKQVLYKEHLTNRETAEILVGVIAQVLGETCSVYTLSIPVSTTYVNRSSFAKHSRGMAAPCPSWELTAWAAGGRSYADIFGGATPDFLRLPVNPLSIGGSIPMPWERMAS